MLAEIYFYFDESSIKTYMIVMGCLSVKTVCNKISSFQESSTCTCRGSEELPTLNLTFIRDGVDTGRCFLPCMVLN